MRFVMPTGRGFRLAHRSAGGNPSFPRQLVADRLPQLSVVLDDSLWVDRPVWCVQLGRLTALPQLPMRLPPGQLRPRSVRRPIAFRPEDGLLRLERIWDEKLGAPLRDAVTFQLPQQLRYPRTRDWRGTYTRPRGGCVYFEGLYVTNWPAIPYRHFLSRRPSAC